ncbi:MAG TPA: ribosome-associated translation inhibitor RaiA [Thermodesulfobacteriota bacterium]|nr:ribosome-associated translation inhibitor RaiA [Thermodesulfobacteriota bacterium]
MQVSVTFRNMESKDVWREYVEEKISKLKKYLDYPLEADVVLTTEKHRQIAEVNLSANRLTINAREETEDMSSAIDGMVEKLERQLLKHKEKSRRQKPNAIPSEDARGESTPGSGAELAEPRVTETRRVKVRPMSIEEASAQMDAQGDHFFIFTNLESKRLNVLYRGEDGHFGLIETEEG